MKLLYMWLENYNDRIIDQELIFSPEFSIHYNSALNKLTVKKNDEYIDNFYGSNILDITAVVGENGSGKTTLTKCIYDICHSVDPVDEEKEFRRIVIYKEENRAKHKEKLNIFYFENRGIEFEIKNIDFELIKLHEIMGDEYIRALEKHKMSAVFFTNAFDISHITRNQGLVESSERNIRKSMCFSPALMLKREMRYIKDCYGAQAIKSGLILNGIQQYAEKMGVDVDEAYASAFSYNFLITVQHTPNAIAVLLPVLKEFELSIVPFGKYILDQKNNSLMSHFDKCIYFIRKKIYKRLIEKLPDNNWVKIYINILCEIVMFLDVFKEEYINAYFIDTLNNSNAGHTDVFDTIIEHIDNSEKKELINRIRNVEKVDIQILQDFLKGVKDLVLPLAETKWYKQVENFKYVYENSYQYMKIPNKIDCGYNKLIDILLNDHYNSETIWNRMVKIIPNPMSSGEVALINIFSSIYKLILEKTEGNILLIIDEIDAFLHPKWQQDILTHIITWINKGEKFKEKNVQIIFASHSPIILSDIPRDRVIYISNLCHVIPKDNLTFGANINRLFYDSFFMEKGSIGAFAKNKIQNVIDYIEGKECNLTHQEIDYIINNIGEPFVMQKLQRDVRLKRLLGE